MSDLEDIIKEQYGKRAHLNELYNSYYSMRTMHDRGEKLRTLLGKHSCRDKKIFELGAGYGANIPMMLMCGFLKVCMASKCLRTVSCMFQTACIRGCKSSRAMASSRSNSPST